MGRAWLPEEALGVSRDTRIAGVPALNPLFIYTADTVSYHDLFS
jgi:hypothetical protein